MESGSGGLGLGGLEWGSGGSRGVGGLELRPGGWTIAVKGVGLSGRVG